MAKNSIDFERAFAVIKTKRPGLNELFSYVNGPQPLKYSSTKIRDAFREITAHFEINWCSVVVDTSLDRLELNGFDLGKDQKAANDVLSDVFDDLHIDLEADKAHEAALSTEFAYIMVWKNDEGEIELSYNDPRLAHVFYEPSNPRKKSYAAKWFRRADRKHEIVLYYKDRLEHYVSRSEKTTIEKPNNFILESTEDNTYGVIPVFELKTRGEIVKVLSIQDAINKTFADMMVAAEFGAFVQRYVITNSDPGNLKNSPGEIWWIPAGDGMGQQSSVGQFATTDLKNYLDAMNELASDMAIITRTPKHYLMNTGSNLSGEALLAMEAPLVKKVDKHKNRFDASWQDIAQFILQLGGIEVKASKIAIVWAPVESLQPKTQAETRQISFNTGIPLITMLRREGWSEGEIDKLKEDIADEKVNNKTLAQSVLDRLRVEDEQSPDGAESEQ